MFKKWRMRCGGMTEVLGQGWMVDVHGDARDMKNKISSSTAVGRGGRYMMHILDTAGAS